MLCLEKVDCRGDLGVLPVEVKEMMIVGFYQDGMEVSWLHAGQYENGWQG